MNVNKKYLVATLTVSAAFFTALIRHEGFSSKPYADGGGVTTIGIGSTQYPDGSRVKRTDKPINKQRAIEIAQAHVSQDEQRFRASLPDVKLSQAEYDIYLDFVYQYGVAAWQKSSMRRHLLSGSHKQACQALLKYRFVAGKDCSVRSNHCYGVWKRQLERYHTCLAENDEAT